jgi:hypothetical protein
MNRRSVLTVLVLAASAPILLITASGLVSGATNFTVRALFAMTVVHFGILAGVVASTAGMFYSRRNLVIFGAALLSVESIPFLVDGLFVFALLPATVSLVLLSLKLKEERLIIMG